MLRGRPASLIASLPGSPSAALRREVQGLLWPWGHRGGLPASARSRQGKRVILGVARAVGAAPPGGGGACGWFSSAVCGVGATPDASLASRFRASARRYDPPQDVRTPRPGLPVHRPDKGNELPILAQVHRPLSSGVGQRGAALLCGRISARTPRQETTCLSIL
jgi:hypothetical protein